MKKKIFIILIVLVLLITVFKLVMTKSPSKKDIVSELQGKIVYLSREDELLNLYTSDANLKNKKLIYSHKDSYEENKNIIEFYYDEKEDIYYFVAMENGEWSLFFIKEGEEPKFIEVVDTEEINNKNMHISTKFNNVEAVSNKGSIYLIDNEEETELVKFYGIYDEKFNPGFQPIGFSPNGKYLIYDYFGNLTPIGTIVEGIIKDLFKMEGPKSKVYIMDLETKEVNEYIDVDGNVIQWIK